ncbi:MAG: segregation/condensation protein A [Gammaproteobacteria bacterium]|nr:segregation/condensation protein A [Gammaproteobacteria bacterium]MBU1977881.1 segregation/condensation protein A [Gammaproteobacteria bacterium]
MSVIDETHVVRIHGEPLTEMPHDLYIPPEALEVFLETFEGPLDLLLYLIRRQNLDVLNIQMAELTRQYMHYVEMMHAGQLELAAEYLLMAALLIEIKSRMLLPRRDESTEDETDPRAELVRRLLEYEQMKLAAQRLDELPVAGRDFALVQVWLEQAAAKRLPEVSLDDLKQAWLGVLARARVNRHHKVSREELSVREHMSRLLRRLKDERFAEFGALFDPTRGVPELVVTFLAVLELVRESLVVVTQQEPFAPIYVKLNHADT